MDRDWFAAGNIRNDKAFANLVKISHTQIKVGLQYFDLVLQWQTAIVLTMKHWAYFTKYIYICNKDFVEEFLKTENENKLKQMMDICHNASQYITGY